MNRSSLLPVAALSLILAACGSQPPAPEQAPSGVENRNPGLVKPAVPAPVAKDAPPQESFDPMSLAALKDPRSPLSKRSVYFDYDSFAVKEEFQSLLAAHAKFLAANGKMKMLLQGNADERGSREYNLALGQKRADAVRKTLTLLGGRDDQLEGVSLGEEKPACTEQTDDCWAKNRRVDILYSGEY